MGIYINGMEMPKCCDDCWALDEDGDYPRCRITEEQRGYTFNIRERKMSKCPLTEMPEPHGRLIDADALVEVAEQYELEGGTFCIDSVEDLYAWLYDDAPTVIEGSEYREMRGVL